MINEETDLDPFSNRLNLISSIRFQFVAPDGITLTILVNWSVAYAKLGARPKRSVKALAETCQKSTALRKTLLRNKLQPYIDRFGSH